MKQVITHAFVIIGSVLLLFSCSKANLDLNQGTSNPSKSGKPITISATLTDALTKVAFTPGVDGANHPKMVLTWESTDKLRVYNHEDHGSYSDFNLVGGIGSKEGVFTGTPVAASFYDICVLHQGDEAVLAATQTQASEGSTGHIKYVAQANSVTDLGALVFTDVSSVLGLKAKLPTDVATTITSVELIASNNIFFSGNTLTINLTDASGAAGDVLNLYATLPSGNKAIPDGTTLLVKFNSSNDDHTVYTRYVEFPDGKSFASGCLNHLQINASQSDTHAGLTSCNGTTADKAYLIADKYQLLAVADKLEPDATRYFKLVDDVDMDKVSWTPLNPTPFTNVVNFDGNGKKISNLGASLFNDLNGTIVNLTIEDAKVNGGSSITGILANTITTAASTVTNVDVVGGTVTSTSYSGGLIGEIDDVEGATMLTMTNCDVTNTTVSGSLAGGVIGFANAKVSANTCTYSDGTVTASGRYSGGFVASTSATTSVFSSCSVINATVSGDNRVGGFAGQLQKTARIENGSVVGGSVKATTINVGSFVGVCVGIIENSYVDGSTISSDNTTNTTTVGMGGFVGYLDNGASLSKCHTNVSINQAGSYLGGLVGYMVGGTISKCYATGDVTGNYRQVGGLVGALGTSKTFTIENSYASGTVTANSYVGGLIGEVLNNVTKVTVSNSYSSGNVVSSSFGAGGLIGFISAAGVTVQKCAAWNSSVTASNINSGNWSTGSVVGVAFPICTLADNYRNPSMTLTAWWVPSSDYQHPNVESSTHPLVVKSISDGTLAETTAVSIASGQPNRPQYSYHGKVETGKTLSQLASTTLGWSSGVWNFTEDLPKLIF